MLTVNHGKELIFLARQAILSKLNNKDFSIPKNYREKYSLQAGCFVTLKKMNELRGCMGFPESGMQLAEAVKEAATKAAFNDPRFPPLDTPEFNMISIEVSVLTPPKIILVRNPEEYLREVVVGRDGIIIKGVWEYGLLLPQVAIEYRWDAKTFLENACLKAGLQPDAWYDFNKCVVYKFQSQVFSEVSPKGEVVLAVSH